MSWLPAGFEFLSGFAEPVRKRRILMPIQVFADESGGKGHSSHFFLAGFAAEAEKWAEFSNAWAAAMDQAPRIAYFKMSEAVNLRKQFRGFTPAQRDDKLRLLAGTVNRFAEFAFWSGVDLSAHGETWGKHLDAPLKDPYFFPFHEAIEMSANEIWDRGIREKFEIVFDENLIFGRRASSWYQVTRAIWRKRKPDRASILPADPLFRSDDKFFPLQAADLLAGGIRRQYEVPRKKESFDWLMDEFPNVQIIRGTHVWTEYDMRRTLMMGHLVARIDEQVGKKDETLMQVVSEAMQELRPKKK